MDNWMVTREKLHDMNDSSVLIVSHRGKFGMTVMENTALAFEVAVREGAHMVEMDISKTSDGVLIGFHDNDIKRMTGVSGNVADKSYEEIRNMELLTYMGEKNGAYIETFEEMIAPLKDKTILVLDKCWDYWGDVYAVLQKLDMVKQAVFKFYSSAVHLYEEAEKYPDVMFVPMHEYKDDLDSILKLKEKCDIIGIEILPKDKDDEIFSKGYMNFLHKNGMKSWCNSLSYCTRLVFGAGYDDLVSLSKGGDYGWGVLIDQGIDVIQTDWPYELKRYIESRK